MRGCPICGSDNLHPLLEAEGVPVFCNVQWASRDEARAASKARLDIQLCADCGHAHNAAFDGAAVAYSPAYDNSQHFSETFRSYARDLVDRLISAYELRNSAIVDIGCGRGDLLVMLAERGHNRGYGFDPSFAASSDGPLPGNVTIERSVFAREHAAELRPSLVCCRHVLEHVSEPVAFLEEIWRAIAPAGFPVLYVEVPNGEQLLRDQAVWDYIYEHYSYFSKRSLQIALSAAGFDILRLEEDFGSQFLCAEARPRERVCGRRDRSVGNWGSADVAGAAAALQGKLAHWRAWAEEITRDAHPTTVWGAGSKGVMFLNLLRLSAPSPIDFAIDQNPNKTNRFLAVSGQVVKAPEHLSNVPVEEVVVMNPIYNDEIRSSLSVLGSRARMVTA